MEILNGNYMGINNADHYELQTVDGSLIKKSIEQKLSNVNKWCW